MAAVNEDLIALYRTMVTIRQFETRAGELFAAGRIPGFIHLSLGQEASAVGVCSGLRADDYLTTTHRGHGHIIAKGADLKKMVAELFGRQTGYCKGKGGSIHIADFSLGILGASGVVAGGLPIIAGAGFSIRMRRTDQVAVCFFGEVFTLGEDLKAHAGIFGQFKDIPERFPDRIIDTPISEAAIAGVGLGTARTGMRPGVGTCTFPTSSPAAWTRSSTRPPRSAICSAARCGCRWSSGARTARGCEPPPSTPSPSRPGSSTRRV